MIKHKLPANPSRRNPTENLKKITDCEDSKYEAISKRPSSSLIKPEHLNLSSQSSNNFSDSDSSVVVLDSSCSSSQSLNAGKYPSDSSDADSDSDSDVHVIEDCEIVADSRMQLNVSGRDVESVHQVLAGVAVVPEWRNYTCKKWTEGMVDYYDRLEPSRDLDQLQRLLPSDRKLWRLDDVDRYGLQESHRGRYFGRNSHQPCHNCKQRDHLARNCPDPPKKICCHCCGAYGHTHFRCPNKVCLGVNIHFNIFVVSF